MRIAFNPSTVAALIAPPNNKDITFDLRGQNIFARGVKFCGTDTWRDIKINNVSIGSNILDLRNGSNTTLTNTNGVVTINSTWRPVVDNLTSDSTTSSLSAKQGKILKSLIDGKSDSGHNHDDRYLKLTGGTMASNALITFADSGSWDTDKGPQGARGGLYWTGQSDYAKLYAEETREDNLDLVIQFGDDNSNGLSIRNKDNTQTSYISSSGVITTGTFKGNLDWSYITNKPATATRWPSWAEVTGKPSSFTPSTHTHGLSNSVFFLNMPSISGNAKWKEVFGYPVNYNLLLSVRINSPAPEWCVGNYGSGILYGGSDTKGFMSSAYNEPLIMWAGGNGSSDDSVPKWYIGIKGIHKSIYNLATIASEANAAYNLRHSHANKSVLDGITSVLVNNWNTAYTFVNTITGTDTDKVINKWDEIVNFLAGITEDNKLNTLLNSKLSVYELANNTNVGTIKNNGIYYSTSDASSGTLTNSPFNTGFALINMTSYDGGDDLRRSRLAFNAYGEIKVSDDRDLANTAETWYNVLTSKNSGISGSTIKLNGTSITVYNSSTADGRYVKKTGDTMSGALNFANNTWNKVGDDSYMGDCNVSGHFGIKAANTTYPGIAFFNNSGAHLGSLTAYNGNIKYGAYSLRFLDNGNTSVGASTWTNPFSGYNSNAVADGQAICVWGQSSSLSNLAADSGDMSLWLKRVNAKAATLNMVLDGEYYANGNLRLAHVSEIPNSLKNPYALTISLNGTSQGPYDGSAAKNINITPSSIGAATSDHNHDSSYVKYTKVTKSTADNANATPYLYNVENEEVISGYYKYWYIFNMGQYSGGNFGTLIAMPYQDSLTDSELFIRSAKSGSWRTWRRILHSNNYASILDSRYYTESEINNLLSKKLNTSDFNWTNLPSKLAAGNEFNIVNAGFKEAMWFNYLPINDRSKTATITGYHFGNGATGYTSIKASGFIKTGSSSSYVLLGDGGHKLESSLNVSNADTVDYYHADSLFRDLGWWNQNDTHDANAITGNGAVFAYADHANVPTYGVLVTFRGGSDEYRWQMAKSYGNRTLYIRQRNGDNGTWSNWLRLLDESDLTWNNIAGKPSAFNPAAHTHTVFKNNLMIKGTNGVSDSASIHLGIGDSDTGFKWISDGKCLIYANNSAVGEWTSGGMNWFKNPTVNGNKVWNAGNDGSGSGLDADTLDGYHENSFLRYRGTTSTDLEATLWNLIGIKTYHNALPDGLTGVYNYGSVISLPGNGSRFEIYASHISSGNGLYYRSGWDSDKKSWLKFIDSSNIGSQTVASATKLQTARKIWGLSFDGTGNVDNTLRIRQTTGNYCEGIRIQTSDGAWSTIILGATSDSGTNANAWSIHRKSDNNFAISRNSSDGTNGLVMTSVGMGLGTTAPAYRLDVNGDIWCRGALRVGSSATNNYIAFYGNTGDAPGSFVTSFIGEHLWGGNESTELLLMKFNDVGNGTDGITPYGSGPDRIRHIAHAHVFLIMTDTSLGDFATMAATTAVETKLDITRNRITASVPLYLQSDLHVNGTLGVNNIATFNINNQWLTPSVLQIGRLDSSQNESKAVIGVTDGNLHIDAYHGKLLYLNFYNRGEIRLGYQTGSYYISLDGSYYNGTVAHASSAGNADMVDGYHISDESRQVYKNYYTVDSPAGAWILIKFPAWNGYNEIVTISGHGDNRHAYCVVYCGSRNQGIWGYQSNYNCLVVSKIRWKEVDSGKFALVALIDGGITNLTIKATNSLEISKTTADNAAFAISSSFFSSGGVFHGNVDWDNVTGKPSSFIPSAHDHNYILDIANNNHTTFAYSKPGISKDSITWLAVWNGYELRAMNKDQIALSGHTHDDRYYTKAESNAKYITDITTSVNKLTFTKNGSNIDRDIRVNNVLSLGRRNPLTERNAISGIYTYGTYSATDNLAPTNYFETLGFGEGAYGTIEIGGSWISGGKLYWRALRDCCEDWFSWKTILDSSNYSGILDSRYYTESEVNSLLDAKLNRQNLSYGTWNPKGYNLAADYSYNGGDLSISESGGLIHVSVDGYFWLNEGQYRVLDTSDVAGLKNNLTVHLYLSNTDTTWWPLIWGGSSHNNTSDSTGTIYKSHNVLSWLTSSLTLYAPNIQTSNIKNLSVGGGIYWNPYVESTTDGSDAASITLVKTGVAGGTTLVLSLMNDANDTILFQTNGSARLYHNSYPILTTLNTYVSNNKGYINGTEITLVNNADTVDGYHAVSFLKNMGGGNWDFNFNDGFNSGIYYVHSQYTQLNAPSIYGLILDASTDAGHLQLASDFNNIYYIRGCWWTGGGGTWDSWRTIIHSGNISSQSVNYANSAGNADTVDGYHATDGRTFTGNINWSDNWNDTWSDGTNKHPWYGFDHRYPNTGSYSTTISDYFGMTIKTALTLRLDFGTLLLNGTDIHNINVASATKLQTPRSIWGQSFNGTADVNGTIYINNSNSSEGAIRLNNNINSNARISAIDSQVIFNTDAAIRFGGTSWDWNVWAGLKYNHSNKTIYLGLADGSIFNANSALSGGSLRFPGISNVYATTFNGSLSGNASTATNADTVDGYHANGLFTAFGNNAHNITATIGGVTKSFLVNWAADSGKLDGYHASDLLTSVTNTNNGISVTVGGTTKSISNISVNYANSAGSVAWDNVTGKPSTFAPSAHTHKWADITDHITKLSLLTNDTGFVTGSVSGNTITINGSSTTWSNTWRPITDDYELGESGTSLSSLGSLTLYNDLLNSIPNPTNYYWANVKISTSSSTTTSPTVHTLTATRVCAGYNPGIDNSISCSNWFRSSGDTGWYNTTYRGGWYMSDTSWIRAHNGVGIYTSGQIYSSSSIRMGNIYLLNTNEINSASGIHLNYQNSGNISLCVGGGNVGIGTGYPSYKLDVNGLMRASGFHHVNHDNDDAVLLAGGSYKTLNSIYGGDINHPVFLGYLNLDHGNDGTVSSSFYCLGYSVPFTYTRGGHYCKISIPDTTHQAFYIKAATASVNYSGGGMDTWTGDRRGVGAWWLHCYASSSNEVRVKGFCQKDTNNDSWWGGNPLWSENSGANRITVCIFGHVAFR